MRERGRPRLWMDDVKVAFNSKRMMVEAALRNARKIRRSGEPWCSVLVFFRTALPRSSGLSPVEGWDAVT